MRLWPFPTGIPSLEENIGLQPIMHGTGVITEVYTQGGAEAETKVRKCTLASNQHTSGYKGTGVLA